jgi:hypothetical protein
MVFSLGKESNLNVPKKLLLDKYGVNETGVRTNLFTNLAMTVVSGIGLLGLAFKKKESK